MTITMRGNVTVSTLYNTQIANGSFPHRGAMETIYRIIRRNHTLASYNPVNVQNQLNGGAYIGFAASLNMPIRSCHGDPNLHVNVNGVQYNAVEPQANAAFQAGNIEMCWWDYGRNASTPHVPNPAVNMAAFVEFNLEAFSNGRLVQLQTQTAWYIGAVAPAARIAMGAPVNAIAAPDGPRLLYHMIGDFFVYSPNHYTDGYIVTDDNNDLLQTRNFI